MQLNILASLYTTSCLGTKKTYLPYSFYLELKQWNSLPVTLATAPSLNVFRVESVS